MAEKSVKKVEAVDPHASSEISLESPSHKPGIGFQREDGKVVDALGKELKQTTVNIHSPK